MMRRFKSAIDGGTRASGLGQGVQDRVTMRWNAGGLLSAGYEALTAAQVDEEIEEP